MRRHEERLRFAPTDLAGFLGCRHKTGLDRLVALGRLARPVWEDPLAAVLRERGAEHERDYVRSLEARDLRIADLTGSSDGGGAKEAIEGIEAIEAIDAIDAMRAGYDVIVQGLLRTPDWRGYPDILRRVERPSALGAWSYEAIDTKLSRETRGGTILQLCGYSDMLSVLQGVAPEYFEVVTPTAVERYRYDDFAAFYRSVKARFTAFATEGAEHEATYPDPVDHCDVCRWWGQCNARRRRDDHLSFVAGLGRVQRIELEGRGVDTLARLAALPLPLAFKPRRGARETYERLREQARLQDRQRTTGQPTFERLPIDATGTRGLSRLPAPSPGDLFLDLEGDPFARPGHAGAPGEGGREYLFGLGRVERDGRFTYTARWAFTDAEERAAFDAVMTDIQSAIAAHPDAHVYHYAPYEPAALKRLMGRYAWRESDLDVLLRGGRFVDLYAVVRESLRAGVETYSIKALEPFFGFAREVALDRAGDQRRIVEIALELNDLDRVTPDVRSAVEGYNKDDCRSTLELRRWLETLRDEAIASGAHVPRPETASGEASEDVSERQARIQALRDRLVADVPADLERRTPDAQARHLLAYLLDWHYREDKVVWWEYFRLVDLPEDDLVDEPLAVAGLEFVERVAVVKSKTGKPTGSVIDRYRYPLQEIEIRRGMKLTLQDQRRLGEVVRTDRGARTLDVRKGPSIADEHPRSAFAHDRFSPEVPAGAIFRFGEEVAASGFAAAANRAAVDLLCGRRDDGRAFEIAAGESATDAAIRIAASAATALLPIQGPPGSGKTYTGARMICELVRLGRRVGVTATSHKVIRNLLDEVAKSAAALGQTVRLGHKGSEAEAAAGSPIVEIETNEEALAGLHDDAIDVLGGTAWLWSREAFARSVDVLFVDEAGQMSLANAIAVSQAAPMLVLLGDPQQLEQPQKASHPDGTGVSALAHVLGGHDTMPSDRGLFLPVTWRMAPAICRFTSEVFYEKKLHSRDGLDRQRLDGSRFAGAGLWVIDVPHDGCRNSSDEEVEVVATIVSDLLGSGSTWTNDTGEENPVTAADILVVAPFNAQVARLQERLAAASPHALDARHIGTVDKFQGQEAPVVIYSMAASRPEDAPRGMEFLYSLNRLNVATSRARCAAILVASPRLFEPECRTPRQMRLASALCRFRELAEGTGDAK